jgi:hypothetical protein
MTFREDIVSDLSMKGRFIFKGIINKVGGCGLNLFG